MDFIVLDIETTDFSPAKGGRIIEIAAVKVVDNQVVDKFSELINPGLSIPKKITELTSITNEMVENAPSINEVLQRFWKFIDGYVVVAHNAKFDWDTFLIPSFKNVSKYVTGSAVCTLNISKKIYGTKKIDENGNKITINNKLSDICERNNVLLKNAHRAIADCEALAECVLIMANKYPEMKESLENADKIKLDEKHNLTIEYKIHNVKYWELATSKSKKKLPLRRFYVDILPKNVNALTEQCYPGTVIFDINTKSWCNKDFLYNLDYQELEKKVLSFEKAQSLEEIYYKKRRVWKENLMKSQSIKQVG